MFPQYACLPTQNKMNKLMKNWLSAFIVSHHVYFHNKSAAPCGRCCYWWPSAPHSPSGFSYIRFRDISVSKKDSFLVFTRIQPRSTIKKNKNQLFAFCVFSGKTKFFVNTRPNHRKYLCSLLGFHIYVNGPEVKRHHMIVQTIISFMLFSKQLLCNFPAWDQ